MPPFNSTVPTNSALPPWYAERGVAHDFDGRRAFIADDDVAVKIRAGRRQDQRAGGRGLAAAAAEVVDGKSGKAGRLAETQIVIAQRDELVLQLHIAAVDIDRRRFVADCDRSAGRERARAGNSPAVVPIVSVPLPSLRLLKMMPLSAWTAAVTLSGMPSASNVRLVRKRRWFRWERRRAN